MGTDRDLIFEGSCSCGKGKYVVSLCTPDHPYAKDDQYSYELTITCEECSDRYALEVRGKKVYRILESELRNKKRIEKLWHHKSEQIMRHAEKKGYLEALKNKIDKMPSISKIYQALKPALNLYMTEGTFRKHFGDTEKWIRNNIYSSNMKEVMAFLKIEDDELSAMIREEKELWGLAEQPPPVLEPAICTVPREGKK